VFRLRVWAIVFVVALMGCGPAGERSEPNQQDSVAPASLPVLAVAENPGWHYLAIDSLGLRFWLPKTLGLDVRGAGSACLAWNVQPFIDSDDPPESFATAYFSRGSLGVALQAVGIGWNDAEQSFVSYGRLGASNRLHALWGTRSVLFTGTRIVGVPISEDGPGMALDQVPVLVGVVQRPDACWVLLTLDEYADDLDEITAWQMLEAVRFAGEDSLRALPGQRFVTRFDYAQRARKVINDSEDQLCMLDPPAGVLPGLPVLAVRTTEYLEVQTLWASPERTPCAHRKGVVLSTGEQPAPTGLYEGIGLLVPASVTLRPDTLIMDLDGNGVAERLMTCLQGDSAEVRIVERSGGEDIVRYRTTSALPPTGERCPG
jgi:hypothetical protein